MQSAGQQGPRKSGPQTETHNPEHPSTLISNRNTKLLESPLTHTKYSPAPRSNRNKTRFFPPRSLSSSPRVAFVGPDCSRAAPGPARRSLSALGTAVHRGRERATSHSLAQPKEGALLYGAGPRDHSAKPNGAILIANDMHSPELITVSQHATYDLLIANEFQSQCAPKTASLLPSRVSLRLMSKSRSERRSASRVAAPDASRAASLGTSRVASK